jgi:hypothetical protein
MLTVSKETNNSGESSSLECIHLVVSVLTTSVRRGSHNVYIIKLLIAVHGRHFLPPRTYVGHRPVPSPVLE